MLEAYALHKILNHVGLSERLNVDETSQLAEKLIKELVATVGASTQRDNVGDKQLSSVDSASKGIGEEPVSFAGYCVREVVSLSATLIALRLAKRNR